VRALSLRWFGMALALAGHPAIELKGASNGEETDLMSGGMIIRMSIVTGLLMASTVAEAQLPGGLAMPGTMSLPTAGGAKDSLLRQAQELVSDLVSMKSSGKLAPAQAKQVDSLLPKAQSVTGELEKPQVEAARLPQLAADLSDLQKQASLLKGVTPAR
jgi:hypothetical protein